MNTLSARLAVIVAAGATAISAAGGYHLLQTIPVGGAGVFGALVTVDPVGRRLYVTHNEQVEVIDVDSGKLVGRIAKTPGARAIAVTPEFGRGFVIGPIVARNDQDAVHLTAVHLKKLQGRFVRVDTRERDGVVAEFLQQSGLGVAETVTTMSKGRRFLNREDNGPWVYGLAGHVLS